MRENRVERRPDATRSSRDDNELRCGKDFCWGLSSGTGLDGSFASAGRYVFIEVISNGFEDSEDSEFPDEVLGGRSRVRVSVALWYSRRDCSKPFREVAGSSFFCK